MIVFSVAAMAWSWNSRTCVLKVLVIAILRFHMAAYGLLALAVAVASSAPSQGAETVSLLAAARTDGSAHTWVQSFH